MADTRRITNIITDQVEEFAAHPDVWLRFLLSPSSRNYKLRFDEKVMLFHEAPDASMVATLPAWNKLDFRVARGSRGIPVLAGEPGTDGKIKYYFSIKDTVNKGNHSVSLWSVGEMDNPVILDALGYDGDRDIEEAIHKSIEEKVLEEAEPYIDMMCRMESYLEADEKSRDEMTASFRELACESIFLLVMNRLGIKPKHADAGRFDKIRYYSNFSLFSNLAAMTNMVSIDMIDMLKSVIKQNRRREDDLRVQGEGRAVVSGSRDGGENRLVRDVRETPEELPGTVQAGRLHDENAGRGTGAALPGDRTGSRRTGTEPYSADGGKGQNQRGTESGGSAALGTENERAEGTGERDRSQSGGLQVTASNESVPPITEAEIQEVLSHGGGVSKIRIYEFLLGHDMLADRIRFIKDTYGIGGHSPALSGHRHSMASHDAKGFTIIKYASPVGDVSDEGSDRVFLNWKQVETIITDLIRKDEYLTGKEKLRYEKKSEEKKECNYKLHEGDVVYIDAKKYIFQSFSGSHVCLQDAEYPIFQIKMPKEEFMKKIRMHPMNDYLLQRKDEITEQNQIDEAGDKRIEAAAGQEIKESEGKEENTHSLEGSIVTLDKTEYEVVEDDGEETVLKDLSDQENGERHLLRTETTETVSEHLEGLVTEIDIHEETDTQKIQQTVSPQEAVQYHITDNDLGIGGPKEKFRRNMEAIRTLKKCEEENRMATPDEQAVLARYVGWGGLADAFDPNKEGWIREYEELKGLLTDDEYNAARKSTLTAFYTPLVVARSVYLALENMGLKVGNILDPCCGTGHFIGVQPDAIADGCHTYGIELDSLSGRIAQQLYQKTRIQVCGYEESKLPDSFFDAAVGNVPFGDFKVFDRKYNNRPWLIHDYFFGKTLDKVRPGGVIAFITSKGTMDKKNPAVRQYLAERAELVGAIRLPDTTFKANAGTTVTSDILFLKKREHPVTSPEEDWVHLGMNDGGIEMNQYFIDHPEMVLGHMEMVSTAFGMDSICRENPGTVLKDELERAIGNLSVTIEPYFIEDELEELAETIPADPDVKNFSYTLVDDVLYFREDSVMYQPKKSRMAEERIRGMIGLRERTRELINMQMEEYSEQEIRAAQKRLNLEYDTFVAGYGLINSMGNRLAFQQDESYYLLSSLEVLKEDGTFDRKADIFTRRTISKHVPVTSTETASEALAVSLSEKAGVDLDYMSGLCGLSKDQIIKDLTGVIFRNIVPGDGIRYVTGEEYLSGNVRQKLVYAREAAARGEPDAAINAEALEKVQPVDLTPAEINVRLGATWIPASDIEDFVKELLELDSFYARNLHVTYNKFSGEWKIPEKFVPYGNIRNTVTYGTKRADAMHIIEATLNLRTMRIMDYVEENGKQKAYVNRRETEAAINKQEQIMDAFKEWIWKDPDRRERLCREYNVRYNSTRNRTYDGDFLQFSGINPEITLRGHQKNAVARIMLGGNTLVAHCVGAGKTMALAAAAQEMKRLGLCQKSLFVVPNHLTEQWAAEYMTLYPGANILVATKKDFETKNRKRFCGRISTGDYDAVIIGHSQFERIPMNRDYRIRILEEERDEILAGIEEARYSTGASRSLTIKQLERMRAGIEDKLKKLNDEERKDDVVTFDQLGIDRLFVDEGHFYKNLAVFSKMTNVAGITQTEAKKSSDMYIKCRYMNEKTGGKGVIFATGTPITNSLVEMFTMQRYLQYDDLKAKELLHFDAWASTFGETKTEYELKPEGTGYQVKTRFSRFFNIPELVTMFSQVADIKTEDMLALPVPECERHIISIEASQIQKDMVKELGRRADRVRSGSVDAAEDNMLSITNDGRKLALDQRLIDPDLPENPESKSAVCAEKVYEIWKDTKAERLTQMIFADLSTPDRNKWNVYYELKKKLMEKGVPEKEIAFVHDAKTDKQKDALFKKVREGQVRVIIGSTQKMGAGTNCQDRLIALHHLDCPWRPADLQQQEGRILRQGNQNEKVQIFTYVTKGTFDSYSYQIVENKQKFISQIMTSKSPARVVDDVDSVALNYAEIKACCADDPLIRDKMMLENTVQKLRMLRNSYYSAKYAMEDSINKKYPRQISEMKELIKALTVDSKTVRENTIATEDGICPMVINGTAYTDRKEAGKALLEISDIGSEKRDIGSFRGLTMQMEKTVEDSFNDTLTLWLLGSKAHKITLSTKQATRNISKINEMLDNFGPALAEASAKLSHYEDQLEMAKQEVQKPFEQEDELRRAQSRLDEINRIMEKREETAVPEGIEEEGGIEEDAPDQKKERKRSLA